MPYAICDRCNLVVLTDRYAPRRRHSHSCPWPLRPISREEAFGRRDKAIRHHGCDPGYQPGAFLRAAQALCRRAIHRRARSWRLGIPYRSRKRTDANNN